MSVTSLPPPLALVILLGAWAPPLWASSPLASCQAALQRQSGGASAEDALRACLPLFREPGCQFAWGELLDSPHASPGYGRGVSLSRLAEACEKAYCPLSGMGHQPLCTGSAPPALTAEFSAAWRAFQAEALRREHVPATTSERLAQALQRWAGFLPRPGTRQLLQAITRPEVPGVVALTLWSARGERLGAWVADVDLDEVTLRAVQAAVPPSTGPAAQRAPCLRLEASPSLPPSTTEALLRALRAVCPVDMVSVNDA